MTDITESHGHTLALEWEWDHDGWRAGWWVYIDESPTGLPVDGPRDADASVIMGAAVAKYIGDPPPPDHVKIWGGYTCGTCGVSGVRLWRLDAQSLRCLRCCEGEAGKPKRPYSDQIGWWVPAVPTCDGLSFWGISAVPLAAADWWHALPETSWAP